MNTKYTDMTVDEYCMWLKEKFFKEVRFRVRIFDSGYYFNEQTVVAEVIPPETEKVKPVVMSQEQQLEVSARQQGYSGELCCNTLCGSFRTKRNGTCLTCDDCGETTGCS